MTTQSKSAQSREFPITPFDNADFGAIRTITIEGEPWFVAADVARILGYRIAPHLRPDHSRHGGGNRGPELDARGAETVACVGRVGLRRGQGPGGCGMSTIEQAIAAKPDCCQACHGTGADPISDIVNSLPCGMCGGTGKVRHHTDRQLEQKVHS